MVLKITSSSKLSKSKNSDSPSPRGIFMNQAKYAQEILKKHGMTSCDSIGTPMATKHLDADLSRTLVDQMKYRSKVGALMYLTASRPDIMHITCYCARYQAQPTEKHLTAVKRIFRYLKDTIHMGLWYLKDTGFELTAFSDSNHAGCLDSRKSTSGGIQFLGGDKLINWSLKKQDCTSMSSAEADEDGNPARANVKQALGRLVKETPSNRPPTSDKEMELWVELNRMYEPDKEDQPWTHTQNFMHAPVDWKLYDSCGVHHVTSKDKEIFMLVEKDYPLRKGLALVMICYNLQVENFSQMANDLVLKIYKIANSLR
nr:uncharacterized mitochondrial protein AtMg00810-like [Tanacetum cinerariifolium]